jgi:hypothetical protein
MKVLVVVKFANAGAMHDHQLPLVLSEAGNSRSNGSCLQFGWHIKLASHFTSHFTSHSLLVPS